MIRAVFFDFGGVIARLDRDEIRRLETKFGLPEGAVLKALYGTPEWREVEVGRIPEDGWLRAVGEKLDEFAGRPIPAIRDEWASIWRSLDKDVVELAERLKGPYVVGLISNSTLRLEKELIEPNGLSHLFDLVVNSARVGVAKPDPRIYRLAARRAGVEPRGCLHIDDLPANVDGARAAGFQAIHYAGNFSALVNELRRLQVSW
ncbi:MAG: HAD family phosphatase [Chloroflexi bacterium]|nr:HAD family phosphatase [Chloroflexota bacterium]